MCIGICLLSTKNNLLCFQWFFGFIIFLFYFFIVDVLLLLLLFGLVGFSSNNILYHMKHFAEEVRRDWHKTHPVISKYENFSFDRNYPFLLNLPIHGVKLNNLKINILIYLYLGLHLPTSFLILCIVLASLFLLNFVQFLNCWEFILLFLKEKGFY